MNNRRDFLKYFGIGASIIPVVNGMPNPEAEAKLIAVPQVELPPSPQLLSRDLRSIINGLGPHQLLVILRTPEGERFTFEASTFVTQSKISMLDVTSLSSSVKELIPNPLDEVVWEMKGVLVGSGRTMSHR